MNNKGKSTAGTLAAVMILMVMMLSWITHVVVCIKTVSWGFLIAGALFAPIGMIHGIGIWFGVW